MSDTQPSGRSGGITFTQALTVLFIGLKLAGEIDWSWWLVLCPMGVEVAIEAVHSLIGMGFEVWIATKPPTGIARAYADKAEWVFDHLPELKRRIIITHDKGLLGNENDFLCDDRPHKANCEQFRGTLLRFVDGYHWPQALEYFRELKIGKAAPT